MQKAGSGAELTFIGIVTNGHSMVTVLVTLPEDDDGCSCLRTAPLRLTKHDYQGEIDTTTPAFRDLLRLVWEVQVPYTIEAPVD